MNPETIRFNKLLAEGRELPEELRAAQLQGLTRSPFFPALLAVVHNHWEDFAKAISTQRMATHDGSLQHCAGSMHALEVLQDKLRAACRPPKKQEEAPEE